MTGWKKQMPELRDNIHLRGVPARMVLRAAPPIRPGAGALCSRR